MKYLKEITDWEISNHTYIVNDAGQLVGYIKTGTKERNHLQISNETIL